jgi:hypothetical protein
MKELLKTLEKMIEEDALLPNQERALENMVQAYLHPEDNKGLQDRVKTLEALSGLRVTVRLEKSDQVFDFFFGSKTVKTVYTYKKAKLFAEGMRMALDLVDQASTWQVPT